MTDDWQKTLEVAVKALIGIVIGLVALWILGWVFTFIGGILLGLAGLIAGILRFLVPVAVLAAVVYLVARAVQNGRSAEAAAPTAQGTNSPAYDVHPTASAAPAGPTPGASSTVISPEPPADRTPDA